MSASKPGKHGVVAVLEDGEGRLLFIKRGAQVIRAPGYWCLVGGEVDPGETWQAALEREVREEVGLDVVALEKVHESVSISGEFLLHWLRARLRSPGQSVHPHPVEVAEARWLRPAEALALEPLVPTLRQWLLEVARGQDAP
jgi:8-oxo-dGTP pyrophosphatase MutT (NUDIX family)